MDKYILDIDSATVGTSPNDYIVTLNTPLYNVSNIKLVSGKVPLAQQLVCDTNNVLVIDTVEYNVANGDYSSGTTMASAINSVSGLSATYSSSDDTITITKTGGTTLSFPDGTGTLQEILGFTGEDVAFDSNQVTSGKLNLIGPRSLVLRITNGDDDLDKDVYAESNLMNYTGRLLTFTSDSDAGYYLDFNGLSDPVEHRFHRGSEKIDTDKLRFRWYYSVGNSLKPYDFRGQHHTIKLEISCTTDKLKTLTNLEEQISKIPELPKPLEMPFALPEQRINPIIIYIAVVVVILIGLTFMLLPRTQA